MSNCLFSQPELPGAAMSAVQSPTPGGISDSYMNGIMQHGSPQRTVPHFLLFMYCVPLDYLTSLCSISPQYSVNNPQDCFKN